MSEIGVIPMPGNFRSIEAFRKGRPRHEKLDPFRRRHPRMDLGKRAKIFAPFDALRGFSAAVIAKNEIYEYRRELSDEERDELNRTLTLLRQRTAGGRAARETRIPVAVTYFVPCADSNHEACGSRGQYQTVSGIFRGADPVRSRTLTIDEQRIAFEDILRIRICP